MPPPSRRDQVWSRLEDLSDPIAATEAIAYDFLAKGGKYSRSRTTLFLVRSI